MHRDPIQKIIGHSFLWHSHHMTKPPDLAALICISTGAMLALFSTSAFDKVVPPNFQDSSPASLMEHLKSRHLRLGSVPDLTTI